VDIEPVVGEPQRRAQHLAIGGGKPESVIAGLAGDVAPIVRRAVLNLKRLEKAAGRGDVVGRVPEPLRDRGGHPVLHAERAHTAGPRYQHERVANPPPVVAHDDEIGGERVHPGGDRFEMRHE